MKKLKIDVIKKINGNVFIPGSKSIANRVLLLSSLCFNQKTELINLSSCDDVNDMINVLKKIGVKIIKKSDISETYEILGFKDLHSVNKNKIIELYCGNAGTVFRSILSLMSICSNNNKIIITGDKRIKERPIKDLVDSLIQGGSNIKYIKNNNFPPLLVSGLYKGGNIEIDCSLSSQFISSLLMISPILENDSILNIKSKVVSKPYIDITLKLINKFGVNIKNYNYKTFYIKGNQKYISPKVFRIESDLTNASYFFAASLMKKDNFIRVIGVGKNSIQGDIKLLNILKYMGANIKMFNNFIEIKCKNYYLNNINIDVNDIPDSAMTLAILALHCKKESTLKNIYNWRIKESNRLTAMNNELTKIGAEIIEGNDYLTIIPPKKIKTAEIDTYNDHRIAMCFSLIPILGKSIIIKNPKCVNKTFPKFYECLYKVSKF